MRLVCAALEAAKTQGVNVMGWWSRRVMSLGAGALMDLDGTSTYRRAKRALSSPPTAVALADDWRAVGCDLDAAFVAEIPNQSDTHREILDAPATTSTADTRSTDSADPSDSGPSNPSDPPRRSWRLSDEDSARAVPEFAQLPRSRERDEWRWAIRPLPLNADPNERRRHRMMEIQVQNEIRWIWNEIWLARRIVPLGTGSGEPPMIGRIVLGPPTRFIVQLRPGQLQKDLAAISSRLAAAFEVSDVRVVKLVADWITIELVENIDQVDAYHHEDERMRRRARSTRRARPTSRRGPARKDTS